AASRSVPVPRRAPSKKPVVRGEPSPARNMEQSVSISRPASLPAAVDTTWYGAQDIDIYPRSVVPLRLAPLPGAGVARLLLWWRIDEYGEVVDVSAGEPGIPAGWVDAARASLAAIRFTPARKDDQAVRSRLRLSVSFADRD